MKVQSLLNEIELDDKVEFADDVPADKQNHGTAQQAYTAKTDQCWSLLKQIQQAMQDHDARAAKDPKNWGYAGNLDNVIINFEDILHFLKS